MRDFSCKLLAAIFILLIIVSLMDMRQDWIYLTTPQVFSNTVIKSQIEVLDTVTIDGIKLAVVESISNNIYTVVFTDSSLTNSIHDRYDIKRLKKVLVINGNYK